MPKRSGKLPSDPSHAAQPNLAQPTGKAPHRPPTEAKNPAAVELGRRGGLKGGKRRLITMTEAQRKESARKAAAARWQKTRGENVATVSDATTGELREVKIPRDPPSDPDKFATVSDATTGELREVKIRR